jgi:hypothetical protein
MREYEFVLHYDFFDRERNKWVHVELIRSEQRAQYLLGTTAPVTKIEAWKLFEKEAFKVFWKATNKKKRTLAEKLLWLAQQCDQITVSKSDKAGEVTCMTNDYNAKKFTSAQYARAINNAYKWLQAEQIKEMLL